MMNIPVIIFFIRLIKETLLLLLNVRRVGTASDSFHGFYIQIRLSKDYKIIIIIIKTPLEHSSLKIM